MLTPQNIDALFAPLARYTRVALAVSGGGDSMALLRLAREWAARKPDAPSLLVLTVDHRLRRESRQEAEWVAQQVDALGLPHHILAWDAAQPTASQADAREARYTLMARFAGAHNIEAIITAHTSDDVAETFLMRLARGSGIDGLAAMASETVWDGIPILRPLLGVSRDTLRTELDARRAAWLEDPSNAEDRFERVRVRRVLETLGEVGITRMQIMESADRLRRAREAIAAWSSHFIHNETALSPAGYAQLPAAVLRTLPEEVAIHVLKRLLCVVGGRVRAPRLRKLEMLAVQIRAGLDAAITMGGCVISPGREALVICREPGRLRAAPVTVGRGETVIWDRRFHVECGDLPGPVSIAALGERNLPALPRAIRQAHPAPALAALPAVYANGQLLGVPVPGFALAEQRSDAATCMARFIGRAADTGHA